MIEKVVISAENVEKVVLFPESIHTVIIHVLFYMFQVSP